MKTIYLTGAIMLTTVFFACKKELTDSTDVKSTEQTHTTKSTTNSNPQHSLSFTSGGNSGSITYRTYYPDKGDCDEPSLNCLPEVIVTPHFQNALAVLDGRIQSGDLEGIAQFFENTETATALIPYWNEESMSEIREKLLSGTYTFRKEIHESRSLYFLVSSEQLNNSSEFDNVIPFRYSNGIVYRTYYPSKGDCDEPSLNCLPDVIITPIILARLQNFESYDIGDPIFVSHFFQDEDAALEIIPNWNDAIMANIKTKILAGEGAFYVEEHNNKKFYFFGDESMVHKHEFEYVLPYAY